VLPHQPYQQVPFGGMERVRDRMAVVAADDAMMVADGWTGRAASEQGACHGMRPDVPRRRV